MATTEDFIEPLKTNGKTKFIYITIKFTSLVTSFASLCSVNSRSSLDRARVQLTESTHKSQLSKTLGQPRNRLVFEHTCKCFSDFSVSCSLACPKGFIPLPSNSNVILGQPTELQERNLKHAYFYIWTDIVYFLVYAQSVLGFQVSEAF